MKQFTKQSYFQESIPAYFYCTTIYYYRIILQFLPNHAPPTNATVVYSGPTLDVYFFEAGE